MFCNASCTLYHDNGNGYDVTFFPQCYWQDNRGVITGRDGQTKTATIRLVIPTTNEITVAENDFFVKGKGQSINNSSESTISESIKSLGKVHSIASCRQRLYGSASMQHYEFDLR